MDKQFRDSQVPLGTALQQTIAAIEGDRVNVQQLLALIGEQGLLFFCIILTLPFLLPVSIPGVSTAFGLVIIFIGISVTFNRTLWLPSRLLRHQMESEHLIPVLEKGATFFGRLERWMGERLTLLTNGPLVNRVHGLSVIAGGVLLLFPLSFVPFSNTLPALSILLLSLGMIQRDGYAILAGYVALVLTVVYFAGLALLAVLGGQSLLQL